MKYDRSHKVASIAWPVQIKNRWELVVSQAHACELESEQPICRNREPPLAVSHDNFSIPIDSKLLRMREARSANSERADDPPKSIHSLIL